MQTAFGEFSGQVWTTHSHISGHIFGIIFGADFGSNDKMNVDPYKAGFEFGNDVSNQICITRILK